MIKTVQEYLGEYKHQGRINAEVAAIAFQDFDWTGVSGRDPLSPELEFTIDCLAMVNDKIGYLVTGAREHECENIDVYLMVKGCLEKAKKYWQSKGWDYSGPCGSNDSVLYMTMLRYIKVSLLEWNKNSDPKKRNDRTYEVAVAMNMRYREAAERLADKLDATGGATDIAMQDYTTRFADMAYYWNPAALLTRGSIGDTDDAGMMTSLLVMRRAWKSRLTLADFIEMLANKWLHQCPELDHDCGYDGLYSEVEAGKFDILGWDIAGIFKGLDDVGGDFQVFMRGMLGLRQK